ncbi:MAG: 3-hydroxyisobutyrate dehydrogenase [Pseudomonadota bacterium]
MALIGFVGLGNMGGPMAANLVKAGHKVRGYDLSKKNLAKAADAGVEATASVAEAVEGADTIFTMLPEGAAVRSVYQGAGGVFAVAAAGALLVDCSTIDVNAARAVAAAAERAGLDMLDAPVSGGVGGAEAGTLTFMVGGPADAFDRVKPLLAAMGRTMVHAGDPGAGQAAKICNNMILGISMIGVSEAFALGDKLGLDRQKLYDIASQSSGQCWSLTKYCPVPGPLSESPANREYKPGFTAAMMLKDLRLAQGAAASAGAATPLGAEAAALYALFCNAGNDQTDFSGIFKMLSGDRE